MIELELSNKNVVHTNDKNFTTLLKWLSENSSALSRERMRPGPGSVELMQFARKLERVTKREFQVFEQVIAGLTAVQIGEELKISPRTVDLHKSRFIQKMEIGNMVVAARYFSVLETLLATSKQPNIGVKIAAAG